MAARNISVDREWRRQVRRAYYLRAEDFVTEREYNDYLEEVEDIIERLIQESTRPAARRRLDELRAKFSAQTARNLAQHDAERRQREDAIARERDEAAQAKQARLDAEVAAKAAKDQQRIALQEDIRRGTKSVAVARAELRASAAAATAEGGAGPLGRLAAPVAGATQGAGVYTPAQPVAPARPHFVQPLDPAAAKKVVDRVPKYMQRALTDTPGAYEADAAQLRRVRSAAAYDPDGRGTLGWRARYRGEAFDMHAMWQGVSIG